MKEKKLEDLYQIYQSVPLSRPSHIQKNIEQDLPLSPIDRCHQRWADLFFGVWRALYERKPALIFGLLESMKSHGLIDDDYLSKDLLWVNPSDDILKRVRTFRTSAVIPKLKGKKIPPWKKYDLFNAHMDYIKTFFVVRNISRKFRNPAYALKLIKGSLPQIFSELHFVKEKNVPDKFLKELIYLPRKELAIRLVAHIHGFKRSDTFKKRLTKARREYPFPKQLLRSK